MPILRARVLRLAVLHVPPVLDQLLHEDEMTGTNTIQLNEATIIAALTCYFATQFAEGKAPRVLSVSGAKSGTYGNDVTFEVKITDEPAT